MLNVPKNNVLSTKVFAGGKRHTFITSVTLTASVLDKGDKLDQYWKASVTQVEGHESPELALEKGEVLLVEEIYLDIKQEVCVNLLKYDPAADEKAAAARAEDAKKVAAELKSQEDAKAALEKKQQREAEELVAEENMRLEKARRDAEAAEKLKEEQAAAAPAPEPIPLNTDGTQTSQSPEAPHVEETKKKKK